MADPTNKFTTARPNVATTLSSGINASATTAAFNNLGSYTNGDRVLLTLDAHDAGGTETPNVKEVIYGEVSGNSLINVIRAVEGTAQSHSTGAETVDYVTAAHHRLMHDGIVLEHNPEGTHDEALITSRTAETATASGDLALIADVSASNALKKVTMANLIPDSGVATAKLAANSVTAAKMGAPYACLLYKSASQSIANVTFSVITFDSEVFDTGGLHSTASNTSRITIPADYDGYWLINGTLNYAGSGVGARHIALYKNGTVYDLIREDNVASGSSYAATGSWLVKASAADYFELYGYQGSGGGLNVVGGGGVNGAQDWSHFEAVFMGKTA